MEARDLADHCSVLILHIDIKREESWPRNNHSHNSFTLHPLRDKPNSLPHILSVHQHNNMGVSLLEEDQLLEVVAEKVWQSLQYWLQAEFEAVLLL